VTRYRIDDQRQHPADVVVANHFTSTFPRSPFVGRIVAVRKEDDVLRELIDRTLTVTRPDGTSEDRDIADDEFGPVLRDVFRLELSPSELERLARAAPPTPR
jgi:N-hydroxyarylamine O-acetyltransferase